MPSVALHKLSRFGFLLLPRFSLIAFSSAIETLRAANLKSGKPLYSWTILSMHGDAVTASNGLSFDCEALSDAKLPDIVFVCGGVDIPTATTPALVTLLRRLADRCALGSLCTGTYALAKANLLTGYRSAAHWAYHATLREEFRGIELDDDVFVIDRDRFTCSGGTAPIRLMLRIVRARAGPDVARDIADQLILGTVNEGTAHPKLPTFCAVNEGQCLLEAAIRIMEAHIENPLSIVDIALRLNSTDRQLQRLFDKALGTSPVRYYLRLRLRRAKLLLAQTHCSATQIALACGFRSSSHFSHSYRLAYGTSPTKDRTNHGHD
jgi:AraC family transcriptional regulator, glycine betaine-responsive activator